uniref:ATP synthase subunit a n=1 Tax=Goniada japonica TaxID=1644143 RepID=A0A0F6QQ33_9ANNE|nr:ATP synthase F0 subunit 6 [Goniada japonica]AKE32087.1 ATP synthase F0 subunit 6 [Goniada japonica]
MMVDIFSSFDPFINYSYQTMSPMFWMLSFITILFIHSSFWLAPNSILWLLSMPMDIMNTQSSRTKGMNIKGFPSLIVSLFLLIISINMMGLLPYTFSISSHLIFTLVFGLPLWLALIISSITYNPKSFTASLLPSGAPDWLNPFLVLIESMSISFRPITLSFRLAANMSAGHIILGLIGIYTSSSLFISSMSFISLLSIQILYIIFEMGICLIQAYIFCLLLTLYADEHTSD